MSDVLVTVANYVADLISLDSDEVIVGRENYYQDSSEDPLCIIDALALGIPIGTSQSFDEDDEEMTYVANLKANITVDFYGSTANTNYVKLLLMLTTQASYELQKTHEITLFHVPKVTNLKHLEGKTQTDRYQLELVVNYNESVVVDTLRIDTEDITYLNDK